LNYAEVILQRNGRMYLVLTNVDNAVGQWVSFVEINEIGQEINSVSIHRDGSPLVAYPANSAIFNEEGDILLAYGDIKSGPNIYDGIITKLTPDLDTLWTKIYDLPPGLAGCSPDTFVGNIFTAIRQTPEGGYIVAGNYRLNCLPGSNNDRACLLKVDTAGVVEWWQVYPNHRRIFDIEVTPDSGFVFLSTNVDGLKFNKTDKYGQIEWQLVLDNAYTHYPAQDLLMINDSIIAGIGQYVYDNSSSAGYRGIDLFLVNIKTELVVCSHYYKPFISIDCAELHDNFKMLKLDNGFIIAGTALVMAPDSSSAEYKGILLKLDENGDSVWCRYYLNGPFIYWGQFNDIIQLEDKGYLAVGFITPTDYSANPGAWLVRTDSNGYAPGVQTVGIEKPAPLVSTFTIYPNPAQDRIWVEWDHFTASSDVSQVHIVDMSGRERMRYTVSGSTDNRLEIPIRGLNAGLYLLKFESSEGRILTKKFIVQ
jgi:hypothetical protein